MHTEAYSLGGQTFVLINLQSAGSEFFRFNVVNIMDADALAPVDART